MAPSHKESFSDSSYIKLDSQKQKTPSTDNSNKLVSDDKSQDPFLYYSNDEKRMNMLKLKDDDSETETRSVLQESSQRKTRISFELHPSLILGDVLDDLYGTDDSNMDYGSENNSELLYDFDELD